MGEAANVAKAAIDPLAKRLTPPPGARSPGAQHSEKVPSNPYEAPRRTFLPLSQQTRRILKYCRRSAQLIKAL